VTAPPTAGAALLHGLLLLGPLVALLVALPTLTGLSARRRRLGLTLIYGAMLIGLLATTPSDPVGLGSPGFAGAFPAFGGFWLLAALRLRRDPDLSDSLWFLACQAAVALTLVLLAGQMRGLLLGHSPGLTSATAGSLPTLSATAAGLFSACYLLGLTTLVLAAPPGRFPWDYPALATIAAVTLHPAFRLSFVHPLAAGAGGLCLLVGFTITTACLYPPNRWCLKTTSLRLGFALAASLATGFLTSLFTSGPLFSN